MNRGLILALFACALSAYAQQKSRPAAPAAKPVQDLQLYRNKTFGFRYEIPFGWVDRSQKMRENDTGEKEATGKDPAAAEGEVLLAVFERPPEVTGGTINSAVVIASERLSSYPGLRKAEDYLGPLSELTTSKGFKTEGDPLVIEIDGRQLVRADFTRQLSVPPPGDPLTMRQTTLILLAHGEIVSFTFIAGSEDELDNLLDNLHFAPTKSSPH
jgi:hypothetical protein